MNYARQLGAGMPTTRALRRRRRRHGPQDGVLTLQQAAGNRAVGAILARQPGTKEAPKEQDKRTSHVLLPDIGRIELLSFQWGERTRGEREEEAPRFRELSLTTTSGKHSNALLRAAATGTHFKEVEIVHYSSNGAGIRLKLTDVMLVSYTMAGGGESDKPAEMWTLSFGAVKQEFIQPTE